MPEQEKNTQEVIEEAKKALAQPEESEMDELLRLRAEKQEAEIGALVEKLTAQTIAGIKAQKEDEEARLAQIVEDRVSERVKELLGSSTFASAVKSVNYSNRPVRKTPYETPDSERQANGYKGGGIYIPQNRMGEQGNLITFLKRLRAKDYDAINDMQRGSKDLASEYSVYKAKALAEGGGATSAASGPGGGFLVPPEYVLDVISYLYNTVALRRAGTPVLQMNSPQLFQPRMTAPMVATYEGENQPIVATQQTYDQFSLNARNLTGLVPVSNQLLNDSNPSIEADIRGMIADVIRVKEDFQLLWGTGTATAPTGLLNISGITSLPTATNGTALTYNIVLNLIAALSTANIPEKNRVWFYHPNIKKSLMQILDGYGRPIFADFNDVQNSTLLADGTRVATLYGYPAFETSNAPLGTTGSGTTSPLMLADVGFVRIGQMGAMQIDVSTEASYIDGNGLMVGAFQSNQTLFRVIQRHDVGALHPLAIAVQKDALYS